MNRRFEVKIDVPEGCRLIGCKSDGDTAIIVFEDCGGPEIRPIGFCREHSGEVSDDSDEEKRGNPEESPLTPRTKVMIYSGFANGAGTKGKASGRSTG